MVGLLCREGVRYVYFLLVVGLVTLGGLLVRMGRGFGFELEVLA